MKKIDRSLKGAKNFGYTFAALSALVAVQRWWRGRTTAAAIFSVVAIALVAVVLANPRLLDAPNRIWMRFARLLGWINSHVLLTLLFVFVITPYGIVLRLLGRDTIGARWRATPPRWLPAPERLHRHDHYEHLY